MKWLKRILLALLALIVVVSIAAYIWLKQSAPQYSGEVSIPGLQAETNIWFDDSGVPHIYAENKHDLYLAFGYIHAQDRLFQMEMLRRAGSGRLSEIIGRPLLKVDKMFRTLGLSEYAEESAKYLETQKGTGMYDDITAYLEGINLFITQGKTPPEFSIIGIEKTPFTTTDLYCITGAMSFSFSQAQKTEPVIDFIAKKYGSNYLEDIGLWHQSAETFIRSFNGYKKISINDKSVTHHEEQPDVMLEMAKAMQEIESLMPVTPLEGSNSWVVSGDHTKSGEVLFCNDTHIGYLLPQTWYEAHLNAPDFEMYGHFMAGVPFALVGRNRELAWGLTMLLNDDMDFYAEKNNPVNSSQYIFNGETRDYEIKQHTIKIKGEADTVIDVRYTLHGPVINSAFEGMPQDKPVSMYWTYTKVPNRTVDAFYGMNNSISIDQFEKFLPLIHAPGLNINFGDAEGNVAWWACAHLINRPAHVNSWTMLNGENGQDEFSGFYPFDKNPKCINPPWGYIYSANDWPQAIDTTDSAVAQYDTDKAVAEKKTINLLWYPGYYKPQYRAERIRTLLESRNDWDLESMKSVMTDHVSDADKKLLSAFYDILSDSSLFEDYEQQYQFLFNWQGNYDPNEGGPAFFNKLLYHYLHMAMADELGEERFKLFLQTHQIQRTQTALMMKENSQWWDDIRTEKKETRKEIIFSAFEKSIAELNEQFGSNPKVWTWRKAASLEMKHPLGEVALLRSFFNVGPHAVYGGNETIEQAGYLLDSTGNYKVYYGSQMRIMVDFANVDSSLNITPCGQSGHLMSKHYNDQASNYRNLKFRTQYLNKTSVMRFDHLKLLPV